MVTSADCSRVCAFAFGKMEEGGAFEFSQDIVDGALQTALTIFSGAMLPYNTMLAPWFLRSLVHLCISDANKLLLMQSPLLTRLLVEALLVDPAHPRQEQADAVKAGIQCDAAECFMQLAMFGPARDALKQDAEVLDSLRAVVDKGITEEAKKSAEGALMALDPKEGHREIDPDSLHVMMSCARNILLSFREISSGLTGCVCVRNRPMGLPGRRHQNRRGAAGERIRSVVRP